MRRIVEIRDEKGWSLYQIFSKCKYSNEGYLETRFDPDLKPYFLELKNNFTQFKIETLMKIPSTYSYRLYEILKSHFEKYKANDKIVYLNVEIKELQEKLNINNKHAPSYKEWGRFTQKVLKSAQIHSGKHFFWHN